MTIRSRLTAAYLIALAAILTANGAWADEWPRKHEVKALNKAYTQAINRSYYVYDGALADRLNQLLAQVTYADEVCDLSAYGPAHQGAGAALLPASDPGREAATAQLESIYEALPHPGIERGALIERWKRRYCPLMGPDGEWLYRPAHVAEFTLPCLVTLRSDRKEILWCKRTAKFFSAQMKAAAEAGLPQIKAAFQACGARADFDKIAAGLRMADKAAAMDERGREGLIDQLVDAYDLRRHKKAGLASDMLREDASLLGRLQGAYATPKFTEWCEKRARN